MRKIEVCLSPELLHLFEVKNKVVVIVDILRATSSMVAGFAYGVKSIVPVAKIDECKALQKKGLLAAAERDGVKVEGFELGNSPFNYMEDFVKGQTIAMTTTNGTLALSKSKAADAIIIGAFINLNAVVDFLERQSLDVVVVCAGWKGHFNLEDTLFAGAVIGALESTFDAAQDSALMAKELYKCAGDDLYGFLQNSSHFKRLEHLEISKDVEFCLTLNQFDIVPILKGEELVVAEVVYSR